VRRQIPKFLLPRCVEQNRHPVLQINVLVQLILDPLELFLLGQKILVLGIFFDVVFELVLDFFFLHVHTLQNDSVRAHDVLAEVLLPIELILHVLQERGMVLLLDVVGLDELVGFLRQLQLLIPDFLDVLLQDAYRFVEVRLVESQVPDPLLVLKFVDLADGIDPFDAVLEPLVDFDLLLQRESLVGKLLLMLQDLVVLLGPRNFHVVQCRLQLLDLPLLQSDSVADMV